MNAKPLRRGWNRRRKADPGEQFTVDGVDAAARPTGPRTHHASGPKDGGDRTAPQPDPRGREHDSGRGPRSKCCAHTGIRVEELTELTHHSLVQYRRRAAGNSSRCCTIPPSKTDEERLLVISPELTDVLSAIVVPDPRTRTAASRSWSPTTITKRSGTRRCRYCSSAPSAWRPGPSRSAASARSSTTHSRAPDSPTPPARPLTFAPHDFRRIFTTDAIMNGMPPHIAQLLLGHKDINTTMGYKSVYPEEAINGHRAFIARRRALRPSEEYRRPTDAEWDEFLGHFERRQASPSATADEPTEQAASMNTAASAAHCCGSTPTSGTV